MTVTYSIVETPTGKPRARALGIPFAGIAGPTNALTDVPGVEVGYATLIEGNDVRTGVTAIHPRGQVNPGDPCAAGVHSQNGNGEMTGVSWIEESGTMAGPIAITNTHAVGIAHASIIRWTVKHHPDLAEAWLLNPHTRLDELERQLGLYHAERERCGLPPAAEIPIIKELHVGTDDESAMRAVRPFLEDKYKAYVQWGQSEVLPEGDTLRQAFEQLAEGGRFIVGGPESCARQVREHVERLGATSFLFRFQWPGMPQELVLSSMRRAAEEVFPLLRA